MNEFELKRIASLAMKNGPFLNGNMFPPSKYYRMLYELSNAKNVKLSVVLGVCGGGCCFNLIQTGEKVIGIDVDYNSHKDNIDYLTSHSNFEFWNVDSVISARMVGELNQSVDILFIDTIHTYDRTLEEFNAWKPYLAEDAVVLLDDLFREGMLDAWNELPGDKLRLDELHISGSPTDGGFGVVYNIGE